MVTERDNLVVTFGSARLKQIESHFVEIEVPLKDGTSFNLTADVMNHWIYLLITCAIGKNRLVMERPATC